MPIAYIIGNDFSFGSILYAESSRCPWVTSITQETSWRKSYDYLCMQAGWLKVAIYFHLQKDVAFHLNKPETPSLKDDLCQDLVIIDPLCLGKKIFKFRQCILTFM